MNRKIITSKALRATSGMLLFFLTTIFIAAPSIGAQESTESTQKAVSGTKAEEKNDEVVVIDGKQYPVPPPWTGQKIDAPVLTFESFKPIPTKYTHNNTAVYILAQAQPHLIALLSKAEEDGVTIQVESGYRSENYQRRIFKRMLGEGRTFDDIVRYVAPPGYSQHMLGIAVDFHPSNWRFADTDQFRWLQENGHLFSFAETYSQYNRYKMPWEAWHWSYTGK
jgi:LAS superfamily LD-carboxypeptidase LdcB